MNLGESSDPWQRDFGPPDSPYFSTLSAGLNLPTGEIGPVAPHRNRVRALGSVRGESSAPSVAEAVNGNDDGNGQGNVAEEVI